MNCCSFVIYFSFVFFLKQALTVKAWVARNSLYRLGWPWPHKDLPALPPRVLALKACGTMLSYYSCGLSMIYSEANIHFMSCSKQKAVLLMLDRHICVCMCVYIYMYVCVCERDA